jgi:hypothetical protein
MTERKPNPKPGRFSLEAPYTPVPSESLMGSELLFVPAEHGVIPVAELRHGRCCGCCFDSGHLCLLNNPTNAPEPTLSYVPECSYQQVIFIRDTPEAREQYVVQYFNAIVIGALEDE